MNRGAWWATVHGVAKGWTGLSDLACTHRQFHTGEPWQSSFPGLWVYMFAVWECGSILLELLWQEELEI